MAKEGKRKQSTVRVPVTSTMDLNRPISVKGTPNRPISVKGTPKTSWFTREVYFDALKKVSQPLPPEKESS